LGPNILSTIFSNNLSAFFFQQCDRPSFTPIQNKGKIIVLYL
jgi:hypothetical protein